MQIPLLYDVVIIFGLAVAVLLICHRLHVPAIVGYLFTGILVGPYGFGLLNAVHEVEILAEVGVVLLLFTIGIEFSFERLLKIRKSVLLGGSLQVLLTFTAVYFIARQFGQSENEAIFFGFLISLSSTVIVLKLFHERAEVDSPHGRTTLGILIFQDIIIVPMILITPLLAGAAGSFTEALPVLALKVVAIIGFVLICTKWIVPKVLYQIARTKSQELFILSIVLICFAVAWVTSSAGLSLALGAFLAGLIISESEYSHQALGNILPFRDVFTSFFFVSIGMLLDVGFLFDSPGTIFMIAFGVLILKSLVAGLVTILLGYPMRTAILVGLAISQVGEFSFLLSMTGVENGLLAGDTYQIFLAFSILSMAAAPFIIALAPRAADLIMRLPMPQKLIRGFVPVSEPKKADKKDHLVIIGFGVNGRNVARVARSSDIPYVIIETNPDTVKNEKKRGEPIYYGDSTQESVLHRANIKNARIAVVAINDPSSTRRIVEIVRRLNRKIHLIVRSRYVQEMKPLYKLGANEVIPEEYETSVEIFARVLAKYLIPRDEIERIVAEIRSSDYEMFRKLSRKPSSFSDLHPHLSELEISTLKVISGSLLEGKNLSQLELRTKYGVTVLAIRRNAKIISNPGIDVPLLENDVLFVIGQPEKVIQVAGLSQSKEGVR